MNIVNVKYDWKLFKRSVKHFFQRLRFGHDDSDTWSLDYSLAKLILPRLKRFRDIRGGYPGGLTDTEWEEILNKMIYSFEFAASEKRWGYHDKEEWDKVQEGLDLFARWYFHLWW